MLNRRAFCFHLLSLPATLSIASAQAPWANASPPKPSVWDHLQQLRFVLHDPLEHPFYEWPRTLLSYPIEFQHPVDLERLQLTGAGTGEQVAFQFSAVVRDHTGVQSATLHFFSDLPSGGHREFLLSTAPARTTTRPQVSEHREGNTIVLDSGSIRVRIPATREVHGDAPGPILQVSRGGAWVGSSTLSFLHDPVQHLSATRVEEGPLFIAYELSYETQGGSRYVARVQCSAGLDFVRFQEDMEGLRPEAQGTFTSNWNGFGVTHRQAPNHPYPPPGKILPYDDYAWERIGELWPLYPVPLPDGELPFTLGIYQTWTAMEIGNFANFWDEHSNDALGVFIDNVDEWQDHEYTSHVESPKLLVHYYYQDDHFCWKWPLTRGSRSTCVAFYDHTRDKEAMEEIEHNARGVSQDGVLYQTGLILVSHVERLQNRYGTLDLNCVKDWVLEYPESARHPPVLFSEGVIKNADELERRVMGGPYVCTLPVNGTRENGGVIPGSGRGIVNFSPVPSRQVQGWWVDGFNRLQAGMTERQRRRLTGMYLLIAYVCAGDDFMPLVPMLSGHPNFLADVKGVPAAMSFLFPDHPMASAWASLWQKCVEINTRYNTRPDVKLWDAHGGRWTENLGTYVWAYLRPSLRSEFLLRQYDGTQRFVTPQLAEMADWLVNGLSAPFDGETAAAYHALQTLDDGHQWGAAPPGHGLRRVHPPQGAHSEERIPPRSLWYLGTCLQRYAPLQAEYAMWAARPTNQDMETALGSSDAWDVMYRVPDNLGTHPSLRSRKYTGYGITLRSAVDTPKEISIHLQQIDRGPNYRWGVAAEGGCGVLYYFAAGQAYSYNGSEDVGDRGTQDTDFCTTFGVFKDGEFRSIGENVLSRPFYDLNVGQFAELIPRPNPGAYAAPEYVSRTLLLSGSDYFILCDQVLHEAIRHRLSWFVRRGNSLPTIKFLGGERKTKEFQRTDLQTAASTGVWFDGVGNSIALVSHRTDLEIETTAFGGRIRSSDIDDLVFRNPEPIPFAEGSVLFSGTAGLIRRRKDSCEFALFHGTRIGVSGMIFETADTDLGIGGTIISGQAPCGEFYAPWPSSVTITAPGLTEKTAFYIDGAPRTAQRKANTLVLDLEPGHHHWELTDTLPVPIAPHILRTENHAGGARVFIASVASATYYRIEMSHNNGATWSSAAVHNEPAILLTALPDGQKVHLRATAINSMHESVPGDEYPLYITKDPPPPPDGLLVVLADGAATLSWGEVLGVTEYRLYARTVGESQFRPLYRGLNRTYTDKRPGIRAADLSPREAGPAPHPALVTYCVTAINGNGEGRRTPLADTDPTSWSNWDPRPNEPFRRDFDDQAASASIRMRTEWPHYYPGNESSRSGER